MTEKPITNDKSSRGRVAILSFRLGGSDGISVASEALAHVLGRLRYDVVTIAGEGVADRIVPGLSPAAARPPSPTEIVEVLHDVDLVWVENLLTIPLFPAASAVLADALSARPTIVRHYDPPWHRQRFARVSDFPKDRPPWIHVAPCTWTATELKDRGIQASVIPPAILVGRNGDASVARELLQVPSDQPLFLHPVRAIQRKNLARAVWLAERFGAVYWLTGPAEEGYHGAARQILDAARTTVRWKSFERIGIDHAYAAADLVLFPSDWEGLGMPPLEAAMRNRLSVVGTYPVAEEHRRLGFEWPRPESVATIRALLKDPQRRCEIVEHNRVLAEAHFSVDVISDRLRELLGQWGLLP